ncbi:hypothetical protein JD844_032924 [Phrynosoma platyrhinos]|uniref:Uncharacterized protein n=1 Tax=Phrynosoma platyrhinos TaxID=52577 RepID=A0ABQ7T618_PHRPL|nr:hypothetical protein JD844_032924 [Phrynosoma platyrhinos]
MQETYLVSTENIKFPIHCSKHKKFQVELSLMPYLSSVFPYFEVDVATIARTQNFVYLHHKSYLV